jgi:hypothetical protein
MPEYARDLTYLEPPPTPEPSPQRAPHVVAYIDGRPVDPSARPDRIDKPLRAELTEALSRTVPSSIRRVQYPTPTARERCDEFYRRSDTEVRLYEMNEQIPASGSRACSIVLMRPGLVRKLLCGDPHALAWCHIDQVRKGQTILTGFDNQLAGSGRRGIALHTLVTFDKWDELIGSLQAGEPVIMRVQNDSVSSALELRCAWEVVQFSS